MNHNFKDLSVIRQGESNGDGMVIRIVPLHGVPIYAVSVARDGFSYTGPTWTYLFENEGLTLIDAGESGSFPRLEDGLRSAGFQAKDIQRVIITHGHEDHDGAVAELVAETGAEVWAHDIYGRLQSYDPRTIMGRATSPIQEELNRVAETNEAFRSSSPERDQYLERRKALKIDHPIQPDEQLGDLTLLDAPGHSPDELCMKLDGVVFTGDHVLPEITPHPTMKTEFAPEIKKHLPARYHTESNWFGLATYLKSLKMVADLGPETQILPAHRYFNRGHFNFINTQRAKTIIEHHGERLVQIMDEVGPRTIDLEQLTRGIFENRKLAGNNLLAAMTEVVAHIEVLQDTGDLEVTDRRELAGTGSENYRQFVSQLTS